jgi:threonine dehydrogenase-like Zn-dependent dehydrogenase
VFYQLGGTAPHTVRIAALEQTDSVGIVGQGPIGQIALQAVRALMPEATTVTFDVDESRLETSRRPGASVSVDPRNHEEVATVLSRLGGHVRAAIDPSGAESGVNTALGLAVPLDRVVLSTATQGDLTLQYGEFFARGLTLVAAFVGYRPNDFAQDTARFLQLLAQGDISVGDLATRSLVEDASDVCRRVLQADRALSAPVFAWG